jgi:hypothetical protein
MSRKRYIYDPNATHADGSKGAMVEVSTDYNQPPRDLHYVRGDTPGYLSVASGLWVDGARARREDLKRTGCRPYEGREAEDREAARQRAYAEQKSDAKLHERAERAFAQLSPEKRRHLGD